MTTAGRLEWLWAVDAPLAALALYSGIRWRPWQARGNPLLWALFAAYLWLPVGLGLQVIADVVYATTGDWPLGRAPLHALGIGFLSSLVVAMASRVTLGHSGRPLRMDRYTVGCFMALQAAALIRVASELVVSAGPGWATPLVAASALLWLTGMVLWALRYGPMCLLPRVDGRPG